MADVVDETADTRSFVLDIPAELAETFAYAAGQFCTFRATIDGDPVVALLLDVELARHRRAVHDGGEAGARRA